MVLLVLYRVFASTTGLESFSLRPEKSPKRFFFRWWSCTFFLLCGAYHRFGAENKSALFQDVVHISAVVRLEGENKTRTKPWYAPNSGEKLAELRFLASFFDSQSSSRNIQRVLG